MAAFVLFSAVAWGQAPGVIHNITENNCDSGKVLGSFRGEVRDIYLGGQHELPTGGSAYTSSYSIQVGGCGPVGTPYNPKSFPAATIWLTGFRTHFASRDMPVRRLQAQVQATRWDWGSGELDFDVTMALQNMTGSGDEAFGDVFFEVFLYDPDQVEVVPAAVDPGDYCKLAPGQAGPCETSVSTQVKGKVAGYVMNGFEFFSPDPKVSGVGITPGRIEAGIWYDYQDLGGWVDAVHRCDIDGFNTDTRECRVDALVIVDKSGIFEQRFDWGFDEWNWATSFILSRDATTDLNGNSISARGPMLCGLQYFNLVDDDWLAGKGSLATANIWAGATADSKCNLDPALGNYTVPTMQGYLAVERDPAWPRSPPYYTTVGSTYDMGAGRRFSSTTHFLGSQLK